MARFLNVSTGSSGDVIVNLDDVVTITADDPYRPAQCARIHLRDGTSIKTDHNHSVESLWEAMIGA